MVKLKTVQTVEVDVAMIFSYCEACRISARTLNRKCGNCGRNRAEPNNNKKLMVKAQKNEWDITDKS